MAARPHRLPHARPGPLHGSVARVARRRFDLQRRLALVRRPAHLPARRRQRRAVQRQLARPVRPPRDLDREPPQAELAALRGKLASAASARSIGCAPMSSLSARVTWRSFQAGALRMVLPGLASLPFGIGFGVAAAQKGLSAFETTLMSFTVMAGTSQMVALDIWAQPLPLIALAVSVFVANLRYFVMGAALQPHLPHLPWWMQPPVWYVTVDQNWAVNIAEYRRGHGDLGKFLGGGFVMACIWSGSTLAGHLAAGGVLSDPTAAHRLGLDFVGVAVFVVVATILFRGKRDLAPWAVAIAAALAAKWAMGGNWYIVVGGLAGGLYGAVRDLRKADVRQS
ncbi:MAG: branched-chain amino acid ABC transporter permease [Reyranella sp.]|nr:MAG: branched-chain amino acid ABC transporter permease [Reyranella sp.]